MSNFTTTREVFTRTLDMNFFFNEETHEWSNDNGEAIPQDLSRLFCQLSFRHSHKNDDMIILHINVFVDEEVETADNHPPIADRDFWIENIKLWYNYRLPQNCLLLSKKVHERFATVFAQEIEEIATN
jgi:hypothetical protein